MLSEYVQYSFLLPLFPYFLIFHLLNIFQGFPFRDGRDLDRNRGSNNMGGVVNRRRSDGYNHDRGNYKTITVLVMIVKSLC